MPSITRRLDCRALPACDDIVVDGHQPERELLVICYRACAYRRRESGLSTSETAQGF